MWGLVKASQVMQLVKQYDTEVLNANIELKMGDCFSVTCGNITCFSAACGDITNGFIDIITIANKSSFNTEHFNRYFNLSSGLTMFSNFYEVFSLLHEVGHIITSTHCDREKEMQEMNKEYNSSYDKFVAYRQLESEKAADEYAINFIKEHTVELYMLMNNMNKETAKEEIEFWTNL